MKIRKTRQEQRSDYSYPINVQVGGDKWETKFITIRPGVDGVTEADIKTLHSLDDSEVYYNNKNGRIEEIIYDVHDHAIVTKTFDGTKTSSKYDAKGNLVESKDALGKVTKNIYDALNRVVKEEAGSKITETSYDANGQTIEVKNSNNNTSTKTVYDNNGNVIETIDAFGHSVKTEYDAKNQVLATVDANGNRSTKEYDAYGNVIKETDALGHTKQKVFNEYGLVEKEVDERGFDVTYEYNDDLLVSKITDSKGYTLTVEYNDKLQKVKETNANDGTTEYEYDAYGREIKVTSPNGKVSEKEYDGLGNIVKELSGKKVTENGYDELGRLTKTSINEVVQVKNEYNELNQIVKSYDANNNVSTFKYDENGKVIYSNEKGSISEKEYDVDGNIIKQIDNKTYIAENVYDVANRIIETDKGTIKYSYDDNGNVSKKINDNGRVDLYTYDDLNQLTKLEQGQYTYDYKYDAEKERISQIWTDTKDYHYDKWYNYSEPLDVVGDSEIEDTFKNLKEQAKKKKDNGNVCTSVLSDKYDVTYFIEPEVTEYMLDRNQEYTQVLKSNDTINVYGDTLLQSDNESIITAKNESVVAKVTSQDIKKISYSDYGQTNDIKSGNGYNSETLDQTGLIYLRARYYDPSVSRFVQIDNNYDGEKQSVASQNKYVYTMNNPYKYVDRNGNWSLWGSVCDFVDDVVKSAKKAAKKAVKKVNEWFDNAVKAVNKVINKAVGAVGKVVKGIIDGIGGNSSNKGGGSKSSKPPVKKVKVEAKCPEETKKSSFDSFLDKIQTILDYVGWIPFTIGDIADGLNALISFLRGNVLMGIINIACLALPAAIMAGAKQIGKACSSAVEFISKLSPKAQAMVKTVKGFVTGMRDGIGKIIWLAGEKVIRPIMNKLDDFAKWIGDVFAQALKKYGNLKFAKEYGIKAYSVLKKELARKGLEAHHLVEQRFADALGLSKNSILSVAVDKTEHQAFTNAWRKLIPYGSNYKEYTKDQIYEYAKEVYKGYPALLDATKQALF